MPFIHIYVAKFGQGMLQNLIKCLKFSISLRVIWGTFMMKYLKLLCKCLNGLIQKVCTLITHQNLRTSKLGEDVFKDKLHCCSYTTVLDWSSLSPSGQIISCCNDVSWSCPLTWWVNRSYKVNIPLIKCLQSYLRFQGHFVSSGWSSYRWHTSQLLQNSFTSLCRVGHQSPAVKTFCVVGFPE